MNIPEKMLKFNCWFSIYQSHFPWDVFEDFDRRFVQAPRWTFPAMCCRCYPWSSLCPSRSAPQKVLVGGWRWARKSSWGWPPPRAAGLSRWRRGSRRPGAARRRARRGRRYSRRCAAPHSNFPATRRRKQMITLTFSKILEILEILWDDFGSIRF